MDKHTVQIDLSSLSSADLQVAFQNAGYSGVSINRRWFQYYDPNNEHFVYEVYLDDDGSFNSDEERFANVFVSYSRLKLAVVAEW